VTDLTNPDQGSTTSSDNTTNGVSPSPSGGESDGSIMKPPEKTLLSIGNTVVPHPEEMTPVGPPYHVMGTDHGGAAWAQWHPIAPSTPVETFPALQEENSTEVPGSTTNQVQEEDDETTPISNPPIVKLRICLMGEQGLNDSVPLTNVSLAKNMTCVQSEEDPSASGSGGPVMSNSALGQINSYHQELLRDELFHHHANAVEVELSHENPTSTDLAIPMPPESFWSAVHNNTLAHVNEAQRDREQNREHSGEHPMPPHLSYILQQLESQGLGPGPGPKLRFGDRLSHVNHENGNLFRGLLDPTTPQKGMPTTSTTRRLVASSRALKMRPVSLNGVPPSAGAAPSPLGLNPGNQRRQSKILDLNFSPSAPEGHSHFTPRLQDLRWLQPPPPRNSYGGANGSPPLFYVTKNPAPKGNGYYLIPHSHFSEMPNNNNGGGRMKIRRLLQSQQQQLQQQLPPPLSITTETPQQAMKSYFEDFRQSINPRWAAAQQTY